MSTDNVPDQAELTEEENPLLFWTAYMLAKDGKRKYLGNGKGGYRMFKSLDGPEGLNAYLDKVIHPARRAEVIVQAVQGKIDVPVDDATLQQLQAPAAPTRIPRILDRLPIQLPVSTLSRQTLPPNAIDQLHEFETRMKKKRKRK